jgi:hypothetical protein
VAAANPDQSVLNRPIVRICIDQNGALIGPPGREENLAEQDATGGFLRSIVKVTNPDRYGIVVGDYFV